MSARPGTTGSTFAASATRLAGVSGAVLGWSPDLFWNATPAELASIFEAMQPPADATADAAVLRQLQEQFPDG